MDSFRILLTGANRGLGKDVLHLLLEKNPDYQLIATARANIPQLQEQLNKSYPNCKAKFMQLDLQRTESIDMFIKQVSNHNLHFDVLINNAAYGSQEDFGQKIPSEEVAANTLRINFTGTVQLTQKLLPYLKTNGRVISVSSKLGALRNQGKQIIQKFDNPALKIQDIQGEISRYGQLCRNEEMGGYFKSAYGTSKMMLNAWSRFILAKRLKQTQTAIVMSPGHCQTDMGGPHAKRTSLEGATLIYNHISGKYQNTEFYHSMQPFNFYDCGPQP